MVTRGGFHVGNGINWKGQVFSKMRNHTVTNRMTVCPETQILDYLIYMIFHTAIICDDKYNFESFTLFYNAMVSQHLDNIYPPTLAMRNFIREKAVSAYRCWLLTLGI